MMTRSYALPAPARVLANLFSRVRDMWSELRAAHAIATELAALNALSDTELARMGLTRAVLKRHVRQKHCARVLMGPHGGWDERSKEHTTREP